MSPTNIKFGTSGWRAVIGAEFSFNNLRRVAHAVAAHVKTHKIYGFKGEEYLLYLKEHGKKSSINPCIIVGYDTRYLSHEYAKTVAEVFAIENISVIFSDAAVPTPTIAWQVMSNNAVGGVTITASHNPAEYNGFKWTPFWGGPATPEITEDIEKKINTLTIAEVERRLPFEQGVSSHTIKVIDFHQDYLRQIYSLIDQNTIKKAGLKIAADSIFGTAATYLRPALENFGVKVIGLRENRDVLFGGHSPDTDEENLKELQTAVIKNKLHLGLACDGDADRYGIIDSDGTWISPNMILGLALEHLVKNKGMNGKICRSVMTSHFVDAIGKYHGLETRETPVGFKYIGDLLKTGQYLVGGEESAGMSIMGHVPEKDGILACLIMAEMIAYEKKPLKKLLNDLYKKVGNFINIRVNLRLNEKENIERINERLTIKPPLNIAGFSVWRINDADGFKFIMKDGSWLGLRSSGTEPVIRIYAEAQTKPKLLSFVNAGKKIISGKF
ncbi:MAG: phosphoglucomutase/phosphomannomutase family protein [Elusimicrobia bacterium]|nr:phosphoglucomutase/phosphomannomutase family protein [Elusimicrobiota bacterium]